MDWDSIRQFILEDREIKEYFLLLAGGENPLQAECDRREPFYGIPSPGAAYKNSQTSGYVPEMSVAASGAEDVMAEKSCQISNALFPLLAGHYRREML